MRSSTTAGYISPILTASCQETILIIYNISVQFQFVLLHPVHVYVHLNDFILFTTALSSSKFPRKRWITTLLTTQCCFFSTSLHTIFKIFCYHSRSSMLLLCILTWKTFILCTVIAVSLRGYEVHWIFASHLHKSDDCATVGIGLIIIMFATGLFSQFMVCIPQLQLRACVCPCRVLWSFVSLQANNVNKLDFLHYVICMIGHSCITWTSLLQSSLPILHLLSLITSPRPAILP